MFTKYAQHKDRYVEAKQKGGYFGVKQKNPDSLVFTCIHFCLITARISWLSYTLGLFL